MTVVRFLKHYQGYNAGDIAGFPDEDAAVMLKYHYAKAYIPTVETAVAPVTAVAPATAVAPVTGLPDEASPIGITDATTGEESEMGVPDELKKKAKK